MWCWKCNAVTATGKPNYDNHSAARDKRAWKLEFYESGHINKTTNLIAYFRLFRKQLGWIKFYFK